MNYANNSSSHSHESHSVHEPLLKSKTPQTRSLTTYPLLSRTLQPRHLSKPNSSEKGYASPVPPAHLLTSFSPPHFTSVQRDSSILDSLQYDADEENPSSSLDPLLGERLREGDGSPGSVSLCDNEDYSAQPKLEVRGRNFSNHPFYRKDAKTGPKQVREPGNARK